MADAVGQEALDTVQGGLVDDVALPQKANGVGLRGRHPELLARLRLGGLGQHAEEPLKASRHPYHDGSLEPAAELTLEHRGQVQQRPWIEPEHGVEVTARVVRQDDEPRSAGRVQVERGVDDVLKLWEVAAEALLLRRRLPGENAAALSVPPNKSEGADQIDGHLHRQNVALLVPPIERRGESLRPEWIDIMLQGC